MKITIKTLTYFSIIILAMLQTMASNAGETVVKIERAIVQIAIPKERYKKEYSIYQKENNSSFALTTQEEYVTDFNTFDASNMPIYLADIEGQSIKENSLIPSSISENTNNLLTKIKPKSPEAIFFKDIDNKKWYLILLSKHK